MATGTNKYNNYRPIGLQIDTLLVPMEGHDANGRQVQIVNDEFPTRIDEVNTTLYYIGWAELGEDENEPYWKIKKIEQIGSVWYQEYAYGNQFFRYKWTDRSMLPYA